MNGFLIVALGGGIGAALRYGAGLLTLRVVPTSALPLGTLGVNILGSLAMGFLVGALSLKEGAASMELRLFFATGLLGGFTTFSAFSLEIAGMLREGDVGRAGLYVGLSVMLGVGALFAGLYLARRALA